MPRIVGYSYQADLYCPGCIVGKLPTGPGQAFDGWALAPGARMSAEVNLSEIAAAFGYDRRDEASFDSGEFPKIVLDYMRSSCGECGGLGGDPETDAECDACSTTGIGDRCGTCGGVL